MRRVVLIFLAITLLLNRAFRERAKPAVVWALTPVYGWTVQSRVDEIARALDATRAAGGDVPSSKALPGFLSEYFQRDDAGLDPWSTPYFLSRDTWTLRVASAGPDGQRFTDDDVLSAPLHF